jgi:hypothetical protein
VHTPFVAHYAGVRFARRLRLPGPADAAAWSATALARRLADLCGELVTPRGARASAPSAATATAG